MIGVILARRRPTEDDKSVPRPMHPEHPACASQDVRGTGGTDRDVAPIERPAVGTDTARDRGRKVRFPVRRDRQELMEAADDQQAADIEDTFTVHWEW